MAYDRPWKSFEEQIAILQSRGMEVADEAAALEYLKRVGYYRLSAYWYPFRIFKTVGHDRQGRPITQATDQFVPNTQFVDAVRLYLFDKELRLRLTDALERIEIALRVDIAHLLGERDAFAHLHRDTFHPSFARKRFGRDPRDTFEKWQARCEGMERRSKEDFVQHYRQKHGPRLPIWVAVETWDFGTLSQLFAMMKVPDQRRIARKYGVLDWAVFQSWLRSLNYLRNVCAHHSRLWNRNVIDQPKLPELGTLSWCDDFHGQPQLIARPFLLLSIVRHMTKVVCADTGWHLRLEAHLMTFPAPHAQRRLSLEDMGAPVGWERWWST
ncbi:Abi family protein [Ectothiorhodospira sp. BSL-9]|uniref:Abi family protein n=1 Tax=Ectothiorhodospira sp. BSL-9 TaxID=1442136 RepID=UPI0007B45904|nr:Abi family protein [Ectothiorhodospira sp. BSL-9]ANB02395.1 abortive phage resistance protein [Ectothiorhodospira sp. BSL-9]